MEKNISRSLSLCLSLLFTMTLGESAQAEAPQRALVTHLGDFGFNGRYSSAADINNSGWIVGFAGTNSQAVNGDYETHAFRWNLQGGMEDLGVLGSGTFSGATAINNLGHIVGISNRDNPPECTDDLELNEDCWDRYYKDTRHAFFWNGGMQDLGTLDNSNPYFSSRATDINDPGKIAGASTYYFELPYGPVSEIFISREHAVLWDNGGIRDLGTLPNDNQSRAIAINNAGQVIGVSSGISGTCPFIWDENQGMKPFMSCGVDVRDIDNMGQVVGQAHGHAFIWDATNGVRDLGTLGGDKSYALKINTVCGLTRIVGLSQKRDGSWAIFLWDPNKGMYEVEKPSGASTVDAVSLNTLGQMAGNWSDNFSDDGLFLEWDTDCDGLLDDWEKSGIDWDGDGMVDIDLPAMGADRLHKDIFVEADYFVSSGHSHKPNASALYTVAGAFSDAPVGNPDLTNGIHLHVDAGPDSIMNPVTGETWGALSRSTALAEVASLSFPMGFNDLKSLNFKDTKGNMSRKETFHYAIFAHNLSGKGSTSGVAFQPGSDLMVSLGSWTGSVGSVNEQSGTFMHELGHNLGLGHGGQDEDHYKPNYLSVMNYSFQMSGLIIDKLEGHFDYSRFAPPGLNENNLNEAVGLNGGSDLNNYGTIWYCPDGLPGIANVVNSPIDWNCNENKTENPISVDINKDSFRTILASYKDWANLNFAGGAIGAKGAAYQEPTEPPSMHELTFEEAQELAMRPDLIMTQVSGPSSAAAGSNFIVSDTVFNQTPRVAGMGSFDVGFYLSVDPTITTSDIFLGSREVGGLDPQESSSGVATVTIPVNVLGGQYYLGAIAYYTALNSDMESDTTNNSLAGNIITIVPAPPSALIASDLSAQGGAIQLNWTPSVTPNVTEQRVYRSATPGGQYLVAATFPDKASNAYTDRGLTGGTTYYYVIRAYSGTNESPGSNEASATPVSIPVSVHVTGGAYSLHAGYQEEMSLDVTSLSGQIQGTSWLKYYYTRTRMNLASTQILSVDVVGNRATITGIATVNGVAGYHFIVTVQDGSPDAFGITIHRPDGSLYYEYSQSIAGGDLTIQQ